MASGHAEADTLAVMPPTVRQAHDAGRHIGGDLDGNRNVSHAGANEGSVAGGETARTGVFRMHEERALDGAFDEALGIVHPRVVAAERPPADEHEAARAGPPVNLCATLERA